MLKISDVEPITALNGRFTDGSVAGGISPTRLVAAFFNAVQTELVNIVETSGMQLDKDDSTQVLKALHKMFLQRTEPFADIKSDGAAAVAEALANLGLSSGAPAIGIPFFWPQSAMPNVVMPEWAGMTFLKLNGATFTAAQYPKLALVWPGLTLTESRGEFIRIADDGRGVDAGRAVLTTQGDTMRNITGKLPHVFGGNALFQTSGSSGALGSADAAPPYALNTLAQSASAGVYGSAIAFDASKSPGVSVGVENRPRNIAFNFLVRAA